MSNNLPQYSFEFFHIGNLYLLLKQLLYFLFSLYNFYFFSQFYHSNNWNLILDRSDIRKEIKGNTCEVLTFIVVFGADYIVYTLHWV